MAKQISELTALGATPDDSDNLVIDDSGVTKKVTAAQLKGDCVRSGKSNALSTTSGTQIGTAAAQLIGFYGATPVIQQAATNDLKTSLQNLGLVGSGANTPLNLGTGALTAGAATLTSVASTGAVSGSSLSATGAVSGSSLSATGAVTSSGTSGIGYATGAGGTVTQQTSRATAVQIDKTCGSITLFSAAGSTTAASFTVNNSTVGINDCIILNQRSGTNKYLLDVTTIAAGSFEITFRSSVGTATDAPVFNFAVIKAVTS